jgi:hypothetical protein
VLTWDEESGEVRKGLHDVVQERLELVREVDVVNDHVVVAGLLAELVTNLVTNSRRRKISDGQLPEKSGGQGRD